MTHEKTEGSRAEVWHGTAKKTSGGLLKSDLMKTKAGRIVSKKKHFSAKKEMRLLKHGYGTKKGHFGFVKLGEKSKKHRGTRSRKHRGGTHLSPANVNLGLNISPGGSVAVQTRAGNTTGGSRRKRKH